VRRYSILVAAVVMQLCLGATYSWAVFVAPLRGWTGIGQGLAQAPFTTFYVAFPATTVIAGMVLGRLGPRRSAALGGLLFGGGWLLAGWGNVHFGLTILGVGLLGGIGVGFAYLVPIATCILWFPRHRGLVTGIAVAGFGGGAALIARVADRLIADYDTTPFCALRLLGLCFLVLVPLAGSVMRRPDNAGEPQRRPELLRTVLSRRRFHLLYFAMFAGLTAGLAVNANLKELVPGVDAAVGVAAVGWFALANAAGRIVWGLLFDRTSARTTVTVNLLLQAVLLFAAPWILPATGGLTFFAVLAGFNYGGVLVLYASTAARCWGAQQVGGTYGWLFSANIPAALAPLLAGLIYDARGSFTLPLAAISVLLVLAAWLVVRHGPLEGRVEHSA
jgi:OFA family oxalate/formate antiporter-like MFS transporter